MKKKLLYFGALFIVAGLVFIYLLQNSSNTILPLNRSETTESQHLLNNTANDAESEAKVAVSDSSPDNQEILPEELKPWVGEYLLEVEQEEGDDGKYLAFADISIKPEGDGNFSYWIADIQSKKRIDDDVQCYGEYKIFKDSVELDIEVAAGDTHGIVPKLTIINRNGAFFVRTPVFYATTHDGLIPVKKIK